MTGARPPLPDDYEIPSPGNGWTYNPDSGKNAHAWYAPDQTTSVAVYTGVGDYAYAKVADERVTGGETGLEIYRQEHDGYDDPSRKSEVEGEAVADVIEYAVAWMDQTAPGAWSHPDVFEPVFDAPAGFELDKYFLESRKTTIYYKQADVESAGRLAGAGKPDEYSLETCPYLYIHVWNGSGNATVGLAPWLRAHGPGSKHSEIEPVVETPDECGLDVALTIARTWAREQLGSDESVEADVSGQTELGQYV